MNCGVYAIRNLNNGKSYVGASRNLSNRKRNHFSALNRNEHVNMNLQESFNADGSEAFVFEVLEMVSEERLREVEQSYIDSGEFEFNISLNSVGGCGLDNHPLRDEIVAKLSAAQTGKKRAPEVGEKISKATTGLKRSTETRAKMSAAKTGKRKTAEHKRKLSEAAKGKAKSQEIRDKIGAAKLGKYVGENSTRFTGWYVTPWGKFASLKAAEAACGELMTFVTIQKVCRNPDVQIKSANFGKSKYMVANYDRSIIGKTWADIGFGFKPAI